MKYLMQRCLVIGVILTTLPACWIVDLIKGKKTASESVQMGNSVNVISFGGKTVVTPPEFDKQLKMLIAANPNRFTNK